MSWPTFLLSWKKKLRVIRDYTFGRGIFFIFTSLRCCLSLECEMTEVMLWDLPKMTDSTALFPSEGQRLFGRVSTSLADLKEWKSKQTFSSFSIFSVLGLRDQSEFHMMQNQPPNGKSSGGRIGNIIQKIMYAFISWLNENTITDRYSFDSVKLNVVKHLHREIS